MCMEVAWRDDRGGMLTAAEVKSATALEGCSRHLALSEASGSRSPFYERVTTFTLISIAQMLGRKVTCMY